MTDRQRQWIAQLHQLEKQTLQIIELEAKSVKLLDVDPQELKKDEFEQNYMTMAELLSNVHSNYERIYKEMKDAGVDFDYQYFRNTISVAAEEKRMELMQQSIGLLLDIL